jgi:hypothetical protein
MATKSGKAGRKGAWTVPEAEFHRRVSQALVELERQLALVRRAVERAQQDPASLTIRVPIGPPLIGTGCRFNDEATKVGGGRIGNPVSRTSRTGAPIRKGTRRGS